mgnify:CR=1 FL=1
MSNDFKMPFTEHLTELRTRVIRMLLAVAIGFGGSYAFSEHILKFLKRPLDHSLVFLAPTEAFFVNVKVAFFTGLLLALPVILLELWRFVSPGLLVTEKRFAAPFVILSTLCFLGGAAFCYFLVLPFGIQFLLGFATADLTPMISASNYVTFASYLMLAFGAVFELPLVVVLLTKIGVVTPESLRQNRKYVILGIFVVAALLTPPDIVTQILLGIPLIGLFEISILASRAVERRKQTAADSEDEEEVADRS